MVEELLVNLRSALDGRVAALLTVTLGLYVDLMPGDFRLIVRDARLKTSAQITDAAADHGPTKPRQRRRHRSPIGHGGMMPRLTADSSSALPSVSQDSKVSADA
jgi:hypothetical protein